MPVIDLICNRLPATLLLDDDAFVNPLSGTGCDRVCWPP